MSIATIGSPKKARKVARAHIATLERRAADGPLSLIDRALLDGLRRDVKELDREIRRSRVVRVKSEPLTYEARSPHSYFHDLARSQLGGDLAARARLDRHAQEMRVNPNSGSAGQGQEFSPPYWALAEFAAGIAAGRTLADLVTTRPLPPAVSSVHIPKITTGGTVAIQTVQGSADSSTDEVTADASSSVATISGHIDLSLQLLEQSPMGIGTIDGPIAYDLGRSYGKQLDSQLIIGIGTNGQLLGLQNVNTTGPHVIDGTAMTNIQTFWVGLGKAAAAIGNDRQLPMEAWLMAPRRWAWLATLLDSSNRPVASPSGANPHAHELTPAGGVYPVGPVIGYPVWQAGAIPAGATADFVIACRPSDYRLYEGDSHLLVAKSPLSGTFQTRISLRRYVAFIATRYPTSVSLINNLAQPSGF
jgi:HK97 family phage major capsid protein